MVDLELNAHKHKELSGEVLARGQDCPTSGGHQSRLPGRGQMLRHREQRQHGPALSSAGNGEGAREKATDPLLSEASYISDNGVQSGQPSS